MSMIRNLALGYYRAKFRLLTAISPGYAGKSAFRLFCTPPTRDVKPLTPVFRQAEPLQFRLDGYTIAGYRWNKGGSRRVMIIHGFESTVLNFEKYVMPLVDKGYEVLAFDGPAHGRSSGKRITAIVYRDMIRYVHEHYGPIHSFMGHSFGGFALSLALAELPHDTETRAVFIAPATETSTAIRQFFHMMKLDCRLLEEFDRIIYNIAQQPVAWFSMVRAMEQIRATVLWVHDEGDNITPLKDAAPVRAKNYPNVRFVITKGLGHSRIYRDPSVIDQVVAFL